MTHREIQKAAAASADLFCEVTDCYDEYEVGRHSGYMQGFVDGAQWRIDSVWHIMVESPEDGRIYLAIGRASACRRPEQRGLQGDGHGDEDSDMGVC